MSNEPGNEEEIRNETIMQMTNGNISEKRLMVAGKISCNLVDKIGK